MVSFKIILGVLFGLMVVSIMVLGIITYQSSQTSNETSEIIRNTYEVLDQTEEISSLYKDIQLESNGFFVSKDSAFIVPYDQAKQTILLQLDELRDFMKDSPSQLARIDSLGELLTSLTSFNDSVLIKSKGKTYSQQALLNRVEGNRVFRAKIRKSINDIKREEMKLLIGREKANQESTAAFRNTFLSLLGVIAILLATTFFSIRYNFNKRIRAQQELRKANELFYKLFHESPLGIVISELDTGVIIDCNRAYTELIKYTREEIIGKTAVQLQILENTEQRNELVRGAEEHGVVRDIEAPLKPRDSEPIWCSISMQSIHIQRKQCLLSVIMDMTTHKRAEEELKNVLASEIELNKMKSNFVTLASHEFRTPLTTILSSAFLLENYSFGEHREKASRHLTRIKSSVNNLTSILDEFLSLTKIEEGQVQPNIERINIKEHLENICQNLRTFARPGQQIIYNHLGEFEVYSDPVLLGNIINNLVSNAIKYSPDNSDIYVSSIVNSHIQLSVRDSGIGISKEDQRHLFSRFYRASNAGAVQGTGLGLHIMKHYVDMLKGSISLNSDLGKGSEFKITFDHSASENHTLPAAVNAGITDK